MTTMRAGRVPTGVPARTLEDREEIFLLAAAGLAEGIDYYEDTDERFVELVGRLALADDGWLVRFIGWLRGHDAPASAAVVAAAELVRVRLGAGLTTSGGNRAVISGVLKRADEAGSLLAYWFRRYGRTMPKPIKHGLADAVEELYDERALAIHDTVSAGMRFARVIDFVHPKAATADRRDLFAYALAGRGGTVPESLPMLRAQAALYALTPEQRRETLDRPDLAEAFADAGLTWDLLDGWLLGERDVRAYQAMLPTMGYADRLSRLAELEDCGLPSDVLQRVGAELADPDRVAAERIGPLRLYMAARRTSTKVWAEALECALPASLAGVPSLPGRTLILIDRSVSMFTQVARGSAVTVADQAALFGTALALRAEEANLVQFGTTHHRIEFTPDESPATILGRFWQLGDGNAADAVSARFRGHDRVVIITDEPDGSAWQGPHPASALPAHTPSYIWNVASTGDGHTPGHRRHVFAGLTDGAFAVIPLIEAAHRGDWPF